MVSAVNSGKISCLTRVLRRRPPTRNSSIIRLAATWLRAIQAIGPPTCGAVSTLSATAGLFLVRAWRGRLSLHGLQLHPRQRGWQRAGHDPVAVRQASLNQHRVPSP